MAEQNAVATQQQNTQLSVTVQIKNMISQDAVKKKFAEVLGQKAPQFLASITNVVAGSAQLKKCPANSIMSSAFVAATYDLPIDSNLGFAAIVPYNNSKYNPQTRQWEKHPEAQFQMMYKGFIQLAIRSGYYEKMNCSVVYKDELVSYNPITGEVEFVTDFSQCKNRAEGNAENIVGYYAWAWSLAAMGATNEEIALAMGVSERTIMRWAKEHESFGKALGEGKGVSDAKVIRSLYERATGYEYEEEKKIIEYDKDGNVKPVKIEKTKKHVPPDVTAQIFWLKNRQRDRWQDRPQDYVDQTSDNDAEVQIYLPDNGRDD